MQSVAIFGGTFNPVHWGHLLIAETALDQFSLDAIVWVPTCQPPHKSQALVQFEQRLEMVQRAIADHPAFLVSDIDAQQQGTSYAFRTLQSLQAFYPDTAWYWIIGMDAFQTLPRWWRARDLAAQCVWLVAPRVDEQARNNVGDATAMGQRVTHQLATWSVSLQWHVLEMPAVGISSSLIRQYCRKQRSIRYLVPETVRDYILTKKLYQMS